jgi:hypothetical protein
MIIHWLTLISGLFFGLIPPGLLINSECRYLGFEALLKRVVPSRTHTEPRRRRRWWKLPLVWIDPVRGYVAAFFINQAFTALPDAVGIARLLPVVATFLALLAMVWVQSSGRQSKGETLSPSGFLAGMMLALLPWIVALSAIVIGVTTALAMNSFNAGYMFATMMTATCGYFFLGRSILLPAYTLLVATPMLLNWVRRSKLVIPVRS